MPEDKVRLLAAVITGGKEYCCCYCKWNPCSGCYNYSSWLAAMIQPVRKVQAAVAVVCNPTLLGHHLIQRKLKSYMADIMCCRKVLPVANLGKVVMFKISPLVLLTGAITAGSASCQQSSRLVRYKRDADIPCIACKLLLLCQM